MFAFVPISLRLRLLIVSSVLACVVLTGRPAAAQTPPAGAPVSTVDTGIVEITSVSQSELAPRLNQQVKAVGIIGSYIGDRSHYRFSLDDGSSVVVVGDYPKMGGTHWTVTARVVMNGSTFALSEVSKTQDVVVADSAPGNGLLIGSGVLAVLLIIAVAAALRSRAGQQKLLWESQVKLEQERAAAALALAEQARSMANGKKASLSHSHTIVSIGSLLVVEGPHKNEKFPIQIGENRIGRLSGADNSIVLDRDGEISGTHGIVEISPEGRAFYKDVSRNGSIVDGEAMHQGSRPIQTGSEIEIGGSKLEFTSKIVPGSIEPLEGKSSADALTISDAPTIAEERSAHVADVYPVGAYSGNGATSEAALRAAPTVTTAAPPQEVIVAVPIKTTVRGALEVLDGPDVGQVYALTQTVTTLGRENRDIIFSDEGISRRHASLFVVDGRHVLIDNDSTHGTFVNGARIGSQGYTLSDGDLVAFGSGPTTLKYREG